ncbi:hypothetical protein H8356DRAFT_1350308 [Neocallimastix lanati (nom. inval.)]|nr:hypothetical protein H8356DRAFT_1342257 [Neocallimastix sp. JGI-2020a]KAG4108889.1 hypothetical protein H8356DRAFT_1350308 [Neocallimastix sp. JGI-2020a]
MNIQQVINKLPILEQYGSERKFTFLKEGVEFELREELILLKEKNNLVLTIKYNRLFDDMGEDHKTLNYYKNCKTIKEAMETVEQAERIEKQLRMSSECHYSFRELAIMEENGIIEKNKGNKNRNFKSKKIINCINNKENNNNNYSSNVVNKLGKDNYNIHDNENKNNVYNERTACGNSNFKFNNCYKNNLFGKNYNYPNKRISANVVPLDGIGYDMKICNYYNNIEPITNNASESLNNYLNNLVPTKAINKANEITVLIECYKNIETELINAKCDRNNTTDLNDQTKSSEFCH